MLLALGHASPLTAQDPLQDREYPPVRPHDRPSGPELLRAVRDFLATEVTGADPVPKFHARVAANALRIAEREALLAPATSRPTGKGSPPSAAPMTPSSARRSATARWTTASRTWPRQ